MNHGEPVFSGDFSGEFSGDNQEISPGAYADRYDTDLSRKARLDAKGKSRYIIFQINLKTLLRKLGKHIRIIWTSWYSIRRRKCKSYRHFHCWSVRPPNSSRSNRIHQRAVRHKRYCPNVYNRLHLRESRLLSAMHHRTAESGTKQQQRQQPTVIYSLK